MSNVDYYVMLSCLALLLLHG